MPCLIVSYFYMFLIFFFFAIISNWLGLATLTIVLENKGTRKGVVDLIIETDRKKKKLIYEKDGKEVGVEC